MTWSLEIPIYNCNVAFLIESNAEEVKEFYTQNKKKLSKEGYECIIKDIEDYEETGGATYSEGVDYLVYIRNVKEEDHMDHELYHLTNVILMDRGIAHTREDEPFAYLNGWLHKQWRQIKKDYLKELKDAKAGKSGSGSSEQCEKGQEAEG